MPTQGSQWMEGKQRYPRTDECKGVSVVGPGIHSGRAKPIVSRFMSRNLS